MGNSTPCKISTSKNFTLKLCTRNDVGEVTRHANFGFGAVWTNIEAYNSNSNSSKLYFCVQLLFVETNTGSAVSVAVYRFKNSTEDTEDPGTNNRPVNRRT